MLGIYSLNMLEYCMKHCSYLFLCMAARLLCKERSRIRVVQMDNLRGLVGIRRMDSPECMDKGAVQSEEGAK